LKFMNQPHQMAKNPLPSKISKLLLDCLRPALQRMPRGAGTLFNWLGGNRQGPAWENAGVRNSQGTDHGYHMRLDLADAIERETYYLGRFFEWELHALLQRYLHAGDTFIDAGANI